MQRQSKNRTPFPEKIIRVIEFLLGMRWISGIVLALWLSMVPVQAENWAVLIGIDRYADTTRIQPWATASTDIRALAHTLQNNGFPEDHIQLLVPDGEQKPTRANILVALARLQKNTGPEDTVFLIYSGQGVDIASEPYLLPYDATAKNAVLLTRSALPLRQIQDMLAKINARTLLVVFDMPGSTPLTTSGNLAANTEDSLKAVNNRGLDFKQPPPPSGNKRASLLALFSCSKGETSARWETQDRSYFAYFLDMGLCGAAADSAGNITAGGLADYVRQQVTETVQKEQRKTQTPLLTVSRETDRQQVLLALGATPPDRARLRISTLLPLSRVQVRGASLVNGEYQFTIRESPGFTTRLRIEQENGQVETFAVDVERAKITAFIVPGATRQKSVPADTDLETPEIPETYNSPMEFAPPVTLAEYRAQMVTVPASRFRMGSGKKLLSNAQRGIDYAPEHLTFVSEFRIGRTEVTVGMWEEYCNARKINMPPDPTSGSQEWSQKTAPIVNISFVEATEYCRWARLALPTEAQWEKAARGTDGRRFPWGNRLSPTANRKTAYFAPPEKSTVTVGSYPAGASPYGCLDMAGNVAEWCEDIYLADFYSLPGATKENPVNETQRGTPYRVVRGGDYQHRFGASGSDYLTYRRAALPPTQSKANVGFRCVQNTFREPAVASQEIPH